MKKRAVVLYMRMAVLVSLFTFILGCSDKEVGTLVDSGFKDRQRPAAVFAHEEHNEKAEINECDVCHHIYRHGKKLPDESSEGQKCSECHRLKASKESPIPLMKAYHDMCRACHQRGREEGKKRGPVTCGECHPRKN